MSPRLTASRRAGALALACALGAGGCYRSHVRPGTDAGIDVGPRPGSCGETTCSSPEICCSEECSLCALPARCSWYACPPGVGCGGASGLVCPPDFYCDFPDDRPCGDDGSTGVCRPRPTSCPDVEGMRICGCDGDDGRGNACEINRAGFDVRHIGGCTITTAFSATSARSSCRTDGTRDWELSFFEFFEDCGPHRPRIVVTIRGDLGAPRTYRVSGDGTGVDGTAAFCEADSARCWPLEGEVTVDAFVVGETIRTRYQLGDPAGAQFFSGGSDGFFLCDAPCG